MKILNTEEIRNWDEYTIQNEPIASIDLMERAAGKCTEWLAEHFNISNRFTIFCGKGNNGGDGLAIARMLSEKGSNVIVCILESGYIGTNDFQHNLKRLHQTPARFVQSEKQFPSFTSNEIIIDALFGSGLNRPLEGVAARLVEHINQSGCEIISIDIPSGLSTDHSSKSHPAIKATHTLSFQCYKLAFLVAENADFLGEIHLLDIGLHSGYFQSLQCNYELIDREMVQSIKKPRSRFAHKGNFGHALLVAGSYGKMGAAVLAAKACLRSGAGLLSCHIPKRGYDILQISVPEAMLMTDFNSSFITKIETDLLQFDAIGIGPGIGTASETKIFLQEIFENYRNPVVLDADALNIIAAQKDFLSLIPSGSILTPHPKEFERLFGESENDFERIELALKKAKELNVIIVLKGHHSFIATADGKGFFNSTGNAGMATAGSGDVLTGIITGLLAQGYNSIDAAILGVYLHGLAGDLAVEKSSMEAIIAGDIIEFIGQSFKSIN